MSNFSIDFLNDSLNKFIFMSVPPACRIIDACMKLEEFYSHSCIVPFSFYFNLNNKLKRNDDEGFLAE